MLEDILEGKETHSCMVENSIEDNTNALIVASGYQLPDII